MTTLTASQAVAALQTRALLTSHTPNCTWEEPVSDPCCVAGKVQDALTQLGRAEFAALVEALSVFVWPFDSDLTIEQLREQSTALLARIRARAQEVLDGPS